MHQDWKARHIVVKLPEQRRDLVELLHG
jgi:hypothetical protein